MATTERLMRLTAMLLEGRPITAELIRTRFGVSRATANRDMLMLETVFPAKLKRKIDPSNPAAHYHELTMGAD